MIQRWGERESKIRSLAVENYSAVRESRDETLIIVEEVEIIIAEEWEFLTMCLISLYMCRILWVCILEEMSFEGTERIGSSLMKYTMRDKGGTGGDGWVTFYYYFFNYLNTKINK